MSLSSSSKGLRSRGFIESLEGRICFSTLPPVFPVTGLTLETISSTSIKLRWMDNSTNEASFQIRRGTNPTFDLTWSTVASVAAGRVSWLDTNLLPATTYYYDIIARARTADALPSDIATTSTDAADPFAKLDTSGRLVVRGTSGKDRIIMSLVATDIVATLNGSSLSFDQSTVNRIDVQGQGGNDSISVGLGVGATNLNGGDGNDTLVGSDGNDRLDGGRGADKVVGGDGNDTLIGGAGNDHLYGQNGDDRIDGGAGRDKILGGDGADYLFGGGDSDRIFGEGGIDTLVSGNGKDTLVSD